MTTTINGSSPSITFSDSTTQTTAFTGSASTLTSGTLPAARLPAGSVLQVVQGTYSTVASTSSSTFTDTGLTATITPTSASSKILVLISHTENQKDGASNLIRIQFRLLRAGSEIAVFGTDALYTGAGGTNTGGTSFNYLDSPATTSATAYKTQFASNNAAGSVYVQNGNITSTITLMEIAA